MAGRQKKGSRARHVPERMCIACRRTDTKRTLIRLVRTPEGHVEVDPTGKRAGRGAYICSARPCWERALKRQAIARALRTDLHAEDRAALEAHAQQLPDTEEATATQAERTAS